ncbi:hypothetical protein [Caldivirga sp.]|uniref:hypothetical protein n=1 Tax=Caldivirga sp. TaxID=2080243 RepID=UPI0025BDAA4A|nr:hypothetical protein [Caldivirga sp.]
MIVFRIMIICIALVLTATVALLLIPHGYSNGSFNYTYVILNGSNCVKPSLLYNTSTSLLINITSTYLGLNANPLIISISGLRIMMIPLNSSLYCSAMHEVISSVAYFNVTITFRGINRSLMVTPALQYLISISNIKLTIPVYACDGKYFIKISKG